MRYITNRLPEMTTTNNADILRKNKIAQCDIIIACVENNVQLQHNTCKADQVVAFYVFSKIIWLWKSSWSRFS